MNSRKRIKAGVVGVGYLGRLHAEKYSKMEGAELVGVVDSDMARAREIAALYGTAAFASYKDLFGKVDAVSIVTPTSEHCRIGLEFLSRGVDVMMEKPIANDPGEAGRLVDEAARTGAVLQVGHLERFNGAFLAMMERLKAPLFIEAERVSPFPNRGTDVDVILDVMIHDIDIVLSLAKSDIESLEAWGMTLLSGKTDTARVEIRFENGVFASLKAGRVSKERARRLTIMQPGSILAVDFASQGLSVTRPGKSAGELVHEDIDVVKKDMIMEELVSFIECSRNRKTPLVSGTDGARALKVAGMVQERIRLNSKTPVKAG